MTNELHGVNPPLITPLDADGQLKDDAFRDEIRYHLDAAFPASSSAEAPAKGCG